MKEVQDRKEAEVHLKVILHLQDQVVQAILRLQEAAVQIQEVILRADPVRAVIQAEVRLVIVPLQAVHQEAAAVQAAAEEEDRMKFL